MQQYFQINGILLIYATTSMLIKPEMLRKIVSETQTGIEPAGTDSSHKLEEQIPILA